jgi:triphosphoribosyl-dephospho-CoA synthase
MMECGFSVESLLRRACRLEVLARKPGNVHPDAAFCDLTCDDFLRSADIVAPILAAAPVLGLGVAILDAVTKMQVVLGKNTNLGIILLLAPLAAVPTGQSVSQGIGAVLDGTSVEDARLVYRAIRTAAPGGMGKAAEQDLSQEPTQSLVEVMRLAADRDRVAYQYAHSFRDVIELAVPALLDWMRRTSDWETAVIGLHVQLMGAIPDTLIARKCGADVAVESARRARQVLDAGWPETAAGRVAVARLDGWLREDGHRRNPGTTADLVAASLFVAQRDFGARFGDTPDGAERRGQ